MLLAMAIGLQGCGGGGGGGAVGGDGPGGGAGPAGGGMEVVGGVGDGAGAGSVAAKAAAIQNARIEIAAYTPDGERVDGAVVLSGPGSTYAATLRDPEGKLANGGYLIVNVSREGYADASLRIPFERRPQRLNVPQAELILAPTVVGQPGGSLVLARAENGSFTFGLVRMRDGRTVALAGSRYLAAKANGAQTELEIRIPAGSLPEVERIRAQMASFDSSDPDDARRFPGAYLDARSTRDRPIRIVSLGFDYLNLTDADSGRNLGEVAQQARAARGLRKAAIDWDNPTIITRWLPQGAVDNLLQDACNDPSGVPDIAIPDGTSDCAALRKAYDDGSPTRDRLLGDEARDGFQVPIYTYDPYTGMWDLFGIGTIVDSSFNMIQWSAIPDSNSDGQRRTDDFIAYAKQRQLYVRIYVTNENFQRYYWNLDYPLLFDRPVEVCVSGRLTSGGQPLVGQWLSLQDDDTTQSFNYASTSTDTDGRYTLRAVLIRTGDTDRQGQISYYDPHDYSYETKSVTLGVSPNCTTENIDLSPPSPATVEGRVVSAGGQPRSGYWVTGVSSGAGRRFQAVSGTDGRFSAQVRQGEDYQVYLAGELQGRFTANGRIEGDLEQRDGEDRVVLRDMVAGRPPVAWGYAVSNSLRLRSNQTHTDVPLYVYGYDYDGDYPLQWTVYRGGNCQADGGMSGDREIDSGSFQRDVYEARRDIRLEVGEHHLRLHMRDASGAQTCYDMGRVSIVQDANRPPVIGWLQSDAGAYDHGSRMTFRAYVWDPEGDRLTAAWSTNPALSHSCDGEVRMGTIACTFTAPNLDTTVEVTLTITDDQGAQASRSARVRVGRAPGNLDLIVR
jgi:hypothetical protein